MTIYMGTSKIPPAQTAGEIQRLLAENGATRIDLEYAGCEVQAIRFAMEIKNADGDTMERWFRLPINWQGVYHKLAGSYQNEDQAKRTAWRHVLRWLQAQFAMVECEQVETAQVFLPYMIADDDRSVWDMVKDNQIPALESSRPDQYRLPSAETA